MFPFGDDFFTVGRCQGAGPIGGSGLVGKCSLAAFAGVVGDVHNESGETPVLAADDGSAFECHHRRGNFEAGQVEMSVEWVNTGFLAKYSESVCADCVDCGIGNGEFDGDAGGAKP